MCVHITQQLLLDFKARQEETTQHNTAQHRDKDKDKRQKTKDKRQDGHTSTQDKTAQGKASLIARGYFVNFREHVLDPNTTVRHDWKHTSHTPLV
jgi:hypothetical protein